MYDAIFLCSEHMNLLQIYLTLPLMEFMVIYSHCYKEGDTTHLLNESPY